MAATYPMRPDITRIVISEVHSWRGLEISSGSGQVELKYVQGDSYGRGVALTEDQALTLANDIIERVEKMRRLRAMPTVAPYSQFAEPHGPSEMRQDAMRIDAP